MRDKRSSYEKSHDLGERFVRRQLGLDSGHFSYLLRPAEAPTFILIPGSFSDSFALREIIDHLDQKLQLVVVELRGHGGSWPPPRDSSIAAFGRDILRVVDEMKLESFYIGGHSIGGMIALEVGRVRPHSVRGIVSIEGWTSHHVVPAAFDGLIDNTLSAAQAARNEQLRQRVLQHWTEEQVEEFRTYWKKWDGDAFLRGTDLPILELYGDRGRERPGREKLRIPQKDNIDLQWLAGASHNLHIERPREVARASGDFIAKIEGKRR